MASGSSGRPNSGSKGFDFATDDILCSYEDYSNQESSNGSHGDPVITSSSGQDFHNGRRGRSSMFPGATYSQPEDSFNQDLVSAVEKSLKRNADNLMRFLEGISSRLSQLELYCYNLDKSIGEMRSDLVRDHGEADSKLKFIEKHLQEVHRSVQILRDKQELAETQKELAKLQLAQKESSSSNHSQSTEDRASPQTADPKKTENTADTNNQQLALALPHQVAQPQQPVAPPQQAPSQNVSQQQSYYLTPPQMPNPPNPTQHPQSQYVTSDSQYRNTQLQDPRVAPQPAQSQVNQTPPIQQFPQYQQQLPQQLPPQQVQLHQQPPMQSQVRPPSTVYPPYAPSQPGNQPPPPENPNGMSMQVSYSGIPQPGTSRSDAVPFGYSGAARAAPQQPLPPQQIKGAYGTQPGDGYAASGPHPALPPGSSYMMYDSEGSRAHYQPQPQPSHFTHGGYPPASAPLQTQQNAGPNLMVRNQQFMRNHPRGELIDKLLNMGFRSDHVSSVIQRMEESGQPIDFNSVLDRLNVHPSGASPQRGWSG
ncbi:uncharacterized protein LOC115722186 [Cannabis sativa]|uniref:uncharacterized protein LOC115722186 n=1 Tax=Cannabis sativa TaxID=3483 RepID=UPI0029CA1D8A|nr:uncharacterized protein LOC115722186 [Cannabis sativa]